MISIRTMTLVGWFVGAGICLAASLLSAANGRPPQTFLPVGVSGAVFVTSGALIWRRRPDNPSGPLLMVAGAGEAALVILRYIVPSAEPIDDAFSGAAALLPLAYVLLSFPWGRLPGLIERSAIAFVTASVLVSAVADLLTYEPLLQAPVGVCPPCGANPFRLTDLAAHGPVESVSNIVFVVATALVAGLAIRRWVLASGASRRALAPVLLGGLVTAATFLGFILAPAMLGVPLPFAAQLELLPRVAVPIGLAVTFMQLYAARANLAGAVIQLGGSPSTAQLEGALRTTLNDPTLAVARWSPAAHAYLDREGAHVAVTPTSARAVTFLERAGNPDAAVLHDPSLAEDPALVASIRQTLRFALDAVERRDAVVASAADSTDLPRGEVTFLFGDIESSTALVRRLGDGYAELLATVRAIVRATVGRFGGLVVDLRADECFVVFADVRDAARAGIALEQALQARAWGATCASGCGSASIPGGRS